MLATTPSRDPLVVSNRVGSGKIVTVTVPWLEGAPQTGGSSLAGVALAALDGVIGAVQPVAVDGLPLQWHSSAVRGGGGGGGGGRDDNKIASSYSGNAGDDVVIRTVTLINNDVVAWRGNVTLAAMGACDPHKLACRDIISDASVAWSWLSGTVGGAVRFEAVVAGYVKSHSFHTIFLLCMLSVVHSRPRTTTSLRCEPARLDMDNNRGSRV